MDPTVEVAQLKEEVAWRTKAMEKYEAYIAKVLRQLENLEDHVGAKQCVEWKLQDLHMQEEMEELEAAYAEKFKSCNGDETRHLFVGWSAEVADSVSREKGRWATSKAGACCIPEWGEVIVMIRKTGTVIYANSSMLWWTVQVGGPASLEVYFLHRKFIKKGTECEVGTIVEFDAGPARHDGQNPTALNAVIVGTAVSQ